MYSARRRCKMVKSSEIDQSEIGHLIQQFPGPIKLQSSRLKWCFFIVLGLGMTVASLFACVKALSGLRAGAPDAGLILGLMVFGTMFFGLCTVGFVILFRNGSLQLDENGFEAVGVFRRRYRWNEVSDFGVFYSEGSALVVFKTTKSHWNILETLNAFLAAGRNEGLPDTYGLGGADLAQLMKA